MVPASGSESLLFILQIEGWDDTSSAVELANAINAAFLKPMESFEPLAETSRHLEDLSSFTKPVVDPSKHLRPISLTPAISKIAEEFVVANHVGPAVLSIIDPNQYGGIPKSSTLYSLLSMLHHWSRATDGTGTAVRVVFFDYRKAFDLIDHNILVQKILGLNIPGGVANWVIDFLSHRKQRVKLSTDCLSEWGLVPAGVPQGTKLCPWLMINNLNVDVEDVLAWKYVDDTTIAETVPRGLLGNAQISVSVVEDWSQAHNMQLNADKCDRAEKRLRMRGSS
ncbi:RNA-directed DNA polymerase from mobile element jockey [Exaiptasia diaphana]|nr:RNA-directed DNA polymerase from mobile element jockey [Exaiptasia diaphana]